MPLEDGVKDGFPGEASPDKPAPDDTSFAGRFAPQEGFVMDTSRRMAWLLLALVLTALPVCAAAGDQVLTKCHITCRCLQDNSVGNFAFVIPVDRSPDIGFEADMACKAYGHRVCSDGCNGLKFSYTYQVVSP
jgi:hypothetical protein